MDENTGENTKPAVVILSGHWDIAEPCIKSIRLREKFPYLITLVASSDNLVPKEARDKYEIDVIRGDDPFVFARNANIGIAHVAPKDVILLNDDTVIPEDNMLRHLHAAYDRINDNGSIRVGVLGSLIEGGVGNYWQNAAHVGEWPAHQGKKTTVLAVDGVQPVCFVCVYLSRRMINEIGPLDEKLVEYGFEDNDYCIRARRAGWRTAITSLSRVRHGSGGEKLQRGYNWSLSFARAYPSGSPSQANAEYFRSKYASDLIQGNANSLPKR